MNTHPKDVIKHCPRCGSARFLTNNQGRSFRCEDCKFVYFINPSAAVACMIFDQEGRLLLCRRAEDPEKGKLDLPGGFVEPMETAEEAVKRELKEELQAEALSQKYLISFPNKYVYSEFSVFTLDLVYICEIDQKNELKPGDDVSAIEYIFPEQVKMEDLYSESMRKIVGYYLINSAK